MNVVQPIEVLEFGFVISCIWLMNSRAETNCYQVTSGAREKDLSSVDSIIQEIVQSCAYAKTKQNCSWEEERKNQLKLKSSWKETRVYQ